MKKLLFTVSIVALLATGCNSKQQNPSSTTQPNQSAVQITKIVPVPNATSAPVTTYLKPTMQSVGSLSPTIGGQLYTNQDMGIQIIVPTSWTLGKTNSKNSVSFRNDDAAGKYYEQNKTAFQNITEEDFIANDVVLYIQYFKNFDSYKNFYTYLNKACDSIAQCWEPWKGTPDEIKAFAKIEDQTMYSSNSCGDICEQQFLIEYKGAVYRFNTANFFYTNDGSIEKTLKFLN